MPNKTYTYGDLVVTLTSNFDAIWNDKGSGAARDGEFWHPLAQGSLRPLGSMAIGNYGTLQGSRASADGSFWRPIAPAGYISMGDVAQSGWSAPSTSKVWCLRSDLAADGQYGPESIWDDTKSKADVDVSIWEVYPYTNGFNGSELLPVIAGTFRISAGSHTNPPDLGYAVVPTLKVPKESAEFTDSVPKITANNIPSTGTTYHWTQQAIVWYVEGSWTNGTADQIRRSKTLRTGVTSGESTELAQSTGIELSASGGVGVKLGIKLNYQFTHRTSSTYSEYSEKEITTEILVPAYHATVLFSKRILIKGQRADGSAITGQLDFTANDDVHLSGVDL
ncbi:uncharacterized protein LDX57_001419 [Aspergillus melleus]|uniref:uncharacterized protein n=1 Tax=Aspergillus melleus TaxID=138277 RepID=UPI001E8DE10D|nr:uncharacterized protein LDX57_001419 [Aspergillus melleus]KAH8423660.1 hypothetical protein LDX57_001419 [Aspergillus melleus]